MASRNSLQNAGFNIPKKKSSDFLQKVSLTSRDAQDLLKEVDHSFIDHKYKEKWKLASVEFVRSPEVESSYRAKRLELKDEGRNLQEQLCYLGLNQKFLATKIAREGFRVRSQIHHTLGNSNQGLYLWRHIDPQLRGLERGDAFILVFKVTPGKCKQVPPTNSATVEPTPNFDCHISNLQVRPSDSVRDQYRRSQIYLYEYTEDAEPSKKPRHCLPYALLQYSYEDVPDMTEVSAYNVTKTNRVTPHTAGPGWPVPGRRVSQETVRNVPVEVQGPTIEQPSASFKHYTRPTTPPPASDNWEGALSPVEKENTVDHSLQNGTDSLHSHRAFLSDNTSLGDASDDELDEQMQSIIRQPLINRTRSSSLNVVRDPRIRRQSQEMAPKDIPSEAVGGSEGPWNSSTSSVVESMKKTVDRLLGRDAVHDEPMDRDYRRKVHDDPFNSWGLTWTEGERWSRVEMGGRQPTASNSSVAAPSPRASSPRGSGQTCVGRDMGMRADLLDTRPSGLGRNLLSDSDLASLRGVDTPAKDPLARSSGLGSALLPGRLSDGISPSVSVMRRGSEGRQSTDEDGEFLVLDEYQCSESDEAVGPNLSTGGTGRIPAGHLMSSPGVSGTSPLKSALKKSALPDSVVAKVKKKLSLGDYKLKKQKLKEQAAVQEVSEAETVERPSTSHASVDAPPVKASNSDADFPEPCVKSNTLSALRFASPPNAFSLLQSFTSNDAQVWNSKVNDSKGAMSLTMPEGVSSASDSALTSGSAGKSGTLSKLPSIEKMSFNLQNLGRDRRVRTALSALGSSRTTAERHDTEGGAVSYAQPAVVEDTTSTSVSKYTEKSPVLDRIAKMCQPELTTNSKRSVQLFSGHSAAARREESSVHDSAMDITEEAMQVTEMGKRGEDKVDEKDACENQTVSSHDRRTGADSGACRQESLACHVEGAKVVDEADQAETIDTAPRTAPSGEEQKKPDEETSEPAKCVEDSSSIDADKIEQSAKAKQTVVKMDSRQTDREDVGVEESVSSVDAVCDDMKMDRVPIAGKTQTNTSQGKKTGLKIDLAGLNAGHTMEHLMNDEREVTLSELTTLVRIAKGLRPGRSNHQTPESSARSSAKSSARSSKDSSPDHSKLNLPDAEEGRVDMKTAESSATLKKKDTSDKVQPKAKGKGKKRTDTSPEPQVPVNEEEFEAMIRLAKGLRPGRKIQVSGLGKNPTDDPLPVLEGRGRGRGRGRKSAGRGRKAAKDTTGKGSRSRSANETIAGSDSDVRQDKTARKKKGGRGGWKKKRVKTEDQNKTAGKSAKKFLTDMENPDLKTEFPMTPPDVKREPGQAGEKFKALPISTLGIRHWMEALLMPSLNPQVLLTDLFMAYLKGADFDNCSICQKVIDLAAIEDTADEASAPPPAEETLHADNREDTPASVDDDDDAVSSQFADAASECDETAVVETMSLASVSPEPETLQVTSAKEADAHHLKPDSSELPLKDSVSSSESSSASTQTGRSAVSSASVSTETERPRVTTVSSVDVQCAMDTKLQESVSEVSRSIDQEKLVDAGHSEVQTGAKDESPVSDLPSSVEAQEGAVPAQKYLPKAESGSEEVPIKLPSSHSHLTDAENKGEDVHADQSEAPASKTLDSQDPTVAGDLSSALPERSRTIDKPGMYASARQCPDSQSAVHTSPTSHTSVTTNDFLLTTGFWVHPDEIRNVKADTQPRRTGRLSSPYKRSHSADDVECIADLSLPKVSKLWTSQDTPTQSSDASGRQGPSDVSLPPSRGSTQQYWQRWKMSQGVRDRALEVRDVDRSVQSDVRLQRDRWATGDTQDHDFRSGRESSPGNILTGTTPSAAGSRLVSAECQSHSPAVSHSPLPVVRTSQLQYPPHEIVNEFQDHDYRPLRGMVHLSSQVRTANLPQSCSEASSSSMGQRVTVPGSQPPTVANPSLQDSSQQLSSVPQSGANSMHNTSEMPSKPSTESVKLTPEQLNSLFEIVNKLKKFDRKEIPGLDLIGDQTQDTEAPVSDRQTSEQDQSTKETVSEKSADARASEQAVDAANTSDQWSSCAQTFLQKYQLMTQAKERSPGGQSEPKTCQSLSANTEVVEALKKKYAAESEDTTGDSKPEAETVTDSSESRTKKADDNHVTEAESAGSDVAADIEKVTTDKIHDAEKNIDDRTPAVDAETSANNADAEMTTSGNNDIVPLEEICLNANSDLDVTGTHSDTNLDTVRCRKMAVSLKCSTGLLVKAVAPDKQYTVETEKSDGEISEDDDSSEEATPSSKSSVQQADISLARSIPSLLSTRGATTFKPNKGQGDEVQRTIIPVQAERTFSHIPVTISGQPAPPGTAPDTDCSLPNRAQNSEQSSNRAGSRLSTESASGAVHSTKETSSDQGRKNAYDWFNDILDGKSDKSTEKEQGAGAPAGSLENSRTAATVTPQQAEQAVNVSCGQQAPNSGQRPPNAPHISAVLPTVASQPRFERPMLPHPCFPMEGLPLFQQAVPHIRHPVPPAVHRFPEPVPAPVFAPSGLPPGPLNMQHRIPRGVERPFMQRPVVPGIFVGSLPRPPFSPGMGGLVNQPPVGIVAPMIQGVPPPGVSNTGPVSTSVYSQQPANGTSTSVITSTSTTTSAWSSREPEPPGTRDVTEPPKETVCKTDTHDENSKKELSAGKKDLLDWFSDIFDGKRDTSPEPATKKARLEESPKRTRISRDAESDSKKSRAEREGSSSSTKSQKSTSSGGKSKPSSCKSSPLKSKSGSQSKISFKVGGCSKPKKRLQRSSLSWSDSDSDSSDVEKDRRKKARKKESATSTKKTDSERDKDVRRSSTSEQSSGRHSDRTARSRESRLSSDERKKKSRWDLKTRRSQDVVRDVRESESEGLDEYADALLEGAIGTSLKEQPVNIATVVMRSTASSDNSKSLASSAHTFALPAVARVKATDRTVVKSVPTESASQQREISAPSDGSNVKATGAGSDENLADEPMEYLAHARELILREMETLQSGSQSESEEHAQRNSCSPMSQPTSPLAAPTPSSSDTQCKEEARPVPAEPSEITSQPSKVTSQHSEMTSEPSEMTSQLSTVTSQPSEMTSQPSEVTSQPSTINSEPSEIISQPADRKESGGDDPGVTQTSDDKTQSSAKEQDTRVVVTSSSTSLLEQQEGNLNGLPKTSNGDTRTVVAKSPVKEKSFSDAPVTEEEIAAFKDLFLKSSSSATYVGAKSSTDSGPSKTPVSGATGKATVSPSKQKTVPDQGSSDTKRASSSDRKASSSSSSSSKKEDSSVTPQPVKRRRSSGGQAWSDLLTSGSANNKVEVIGSCQKDKRTLDKEAKSSKDSATSSRHQHEETHQQQSKEQRPRQQSPVRQQKPVQQPAQGQRPSQHRSEHHEQPQHHQHQHHRQQQQQQQQSQPHSSQSVRHSSQAGSSTGSGNTVRDYLVHRYNIKNPEALAGFLPQRLDQDMSKLSKKQRCRLNMRINKNLDKDKPPSSRQTSTTPAPLLPSPAAAAGPLEEFATDIIHIELGLVQECLNLLEAIQVTKSAQSPDGSTWNSSRIGGATEGIQFIEQTYRAQSVYPRVRDALLAVRADFSTAIKDAQSNNRGRGHQCLPAAILLPDEVGKIYSQEGVSLIQLSAIPHHTFNKLLQLKKDIECSWMRQRTFTCSNNTLGVRQEKERLGKFHSLRTNILTTYCGRINKQRLNRLQMASQRYETCSDHLMSVLGRDSVTKMTFFQAYAAAVKKHCQIVAAEMVTSPSQSKSRKRNRQSAV